ncbi:hypothetical protein AB0F13_02065 [Streptomyces sp. NPDC026206]|uniref:hypothetical protein n=1 Tax=Streptomyces sp. NPDC026206 TaxID=3157089 RepID=UPI0033E6019E
MSRASDSSSSGPQGRGGAAYPSGTPPYGTPSGEEPATGAAASAAPPAKPGEPKTETTMTTRIRINIPGSRPIPPVVLRTPVGDEAPAADAAPAPAAGRDAAERRESLPTRPKSDRTSAAPAGSAGAAPSADPDRPEKASDWFAPRKSGPAAPPAPARRQPKSAPAAARGKQPPLPRRGAADPAPDQRPPVRGASAGAAANPWPGDASTTGAVPQVPASGGAAADGTPPWPGGDPSTTAATPWPNGSPAGAMQHPAPGVPGAGGGAPWPGDAQSRGTNPWPGDPSTTGAVPQASAPGGGAANGAAPWPGGSPAASADDWPGGASTTGAAPWPGGRQAAGATPGQSDTPPWPGGQAVPGAAPGAQAPSTTQQFPAPTVGATIGGVPAGGAAYATGRTDTPLEGFPAVGTPQPGSGNPAAQGQAPAKGKKKRGPKAPAPVGNQPGETLVSGVPPVSPAAGQGTKGPVDSGAPRVPVPKPKPAAAAGQPAPAVPKPPAKSAPKSAAKRAPKKKGRSKLVLLGGGLVALVGLAYGAGLLLDHADVPNGTTVLGIDIGGKSKDQAVQTLDSALGKRTGAPLKVSIGGKSADLKPSVAGLSIDTQATVRAAAGRDYNPVTVLSSLIGGSRTAEPTVIADEEKIAAALKTLAGETGTAKEGTIKFEPGKAVPVYGQPYQGVDVDASVEAVSKAFRDRAATGQDKPIVLATSGQQPKVANAEVDRMMKDFGAPAMSGLVTIQTDPAHKIQFGPDRSLPKILSVKEVNGKLVESYDLEALKELYGNAFNGVLIARGNGSKTPVQPTDVAGALGKALRGKAPAERIGTIPLS